MSGVLSSVDARTQLVGQNRLELLLFSLGGRQRFAINVFKVQEVMSLPPLTEIPDRHELVVGVTHLRGQTIPVIDLRRAIKMGTTVIDENSTIIVTEYNMTVQAFLVAGVERIVNMNWNEILPPPVGAGRAHYLTAISRMDDRIVEIIDVEKVLAEITPYNPEISDAWIDDDLVELIKGKQILIADDSQVALNQVTGVLVKLGIDVVATHNGLEAYQVLEAWKAEGKDIANDVLMLITDAEMPEMDGYMLTTEIRKDPELKGMFIVLHTSLSGSFNKAMVEKVGCDGFLSKFQPEKLTREVQRIIRKKLGIEEKEENSDAEL
ncbi:MAG: chemotaxis protein CheV [Oleispira antarctica]|uniref:Response regulator receiver, CheW-like and CheY-like domain n=1 Tax=Oleispira antarctica RB-8 TaxID=698738 RepID=R4YM29_OLEAN|nr:chemotaxis protein CheV [Oleispira antarctica]MBQ0793802.1 chemotaxis protein CheV [Oleispira antarctica]CCK75852.1 Response regulator receiver, CheW-like and CheY-like domain [Oleispira antarctica RB-8]|tara:strand:- start:294 stop:1259 length:966 start_codon:yes stop_codon:yes gene_type:complete